MRTRILAALGGVFVATGMSACSLVGAAEPATAPAAAPATASAGAEAGQGAAAPPAKPQVLRTAQIQGFDRVVVVNGKGRTIYRFDNDSNNPPETSCVDACLRTWEPVLAPNGVQVETGIEEDLVGSITRPDGTEQLTLNGWPMYYFHRDLELGQTAGHGMNGAWFAISTRGARAKREGGSVPSAKPQVLRVVQLDGFSPAVVVNGKGRTIYRFDNDSNNPPRTRCTGECLQKWEPVLAPNGVQVEAGIDEGLVGSITRPDGTRQLTLKGWPLYYFHKDLKLGQTAGHGVNDAWFAISPGGGKTQRT
jgi:predicted lipoprotein with Yx(FWY)xxD motif